MTRHPRTAATILELISAMILFSAAATFTARTLSGIAAMHRATERQQFALQEATNALERLTAMPWQQLTRETAATTLLSTEAKRRLPGAELRVSVNAADDPVPSRRIQVEIRWKNANGPSQAPVRLTAWRDAVDAPEDSP